MAIIFIKWEFEESKERAKEQEKINLQCTCKYGCITGIVYS